MLRCRQFIERFVRGPSGAYRQAFVSLLLAAGAIFVLMTFTACDCDENGVSDCDETANAIRNAEIASMNARLREEAQAVVQAKIINKSQAAVGAAGADGGGQRVTRILVRDLVGSTTATKITYIYTPPDGASDFSFSNYQPEPGWDPTRPVFVFRDLPFNAVVFVDLTLPTASPYGGSQVAESLTVQPDVGPATTAYYLTDLTADLTPATVGDDDDGATPLVTELAAPSMVVDMWTVQHWYNRQVPINSEQCQQAVDLLQSDAAFIALQLPEPPHPADQSALLPVYRNPTIRLTGGDGLDVAGEATFRPERFTFAANELPAEPGKIWVTLGAATTPAVTCPAGKETDAWEIKLDFELDLSYVPGNCAGCALDVFICYEGQELPGSRLAKYVARQQANRMLEQLVRAGDAPAGVRDYRHWGVTCAGPLPLQLLDDPNWEQWMLVGASAQAVTPTWPITLSHRLEGGNFNPPAQIDLAFSSNLDAGWQWSDGENIIVPPVQYAGWQEIYLVGQAPAGAAAGLYATQITATLHGQPADYRVATDLIWVGEWSPPPQGGDATPTTTPTAPPTQAPTMTATASPTVTQTPTVGPTATAKLTPMAKLYLPLVLRAEN